MFCSVAEQVVNVSNPAVAPVLEQAGPPDDAVVSAVESRFVTVKLDAHGFAVQ